MLDRVLAAVLVVPFALGMRSSAPDQGEVELTFRDPDIVESSGLVVQDGLVLTTNDSGDTGRVFAVDPATGETVGVTRWSDEPTDVEALAPAGRGSVWVGDIGDNPGSRSSVQVTRVAVGRGDRSVEEPSYSLVYPDGPTDAESLLRHPVSGRLYIATKSVFGATLYKAPKRLSADAANPLKVVGGVLPIATDAAFFPDGRHLVVRDYAQAALYTFPDLEKVATFRLPTQEQGEGIAVGDDGAVFVSSEGQFSDLVRVRLPEEALAALADPGSGPGEPTASPTTPGAGESSGGTYSREGIELPEQEPVDRPFWPWFLTAWIALGGIVLLMRSLRRR